MYIVIFDADPLNYVWNNMRFILLLVRGAFHEPKPPLAELCKTHTNYEFVKYLIGDVV